MNWCSEYIADGTGVSEVANRVYKEAGSVGTWLDGVQNDARSGPVTTYSVLRNALVWQGLNLIAGDMARIKFRIGPMGSHQPDENHPLHGVLAYQTNRWQTPVEFIEWATMTSIVWGNAIARIVKDRRGRVVSLEPIPTRFIEWYVDEDGIPFYFVTWPDKQSETLETYDVLHFKSLAPSGFWGLRITEIAQDELRLVKDVSAHASTSYRNGGRPSGVLKHKGKPNPEASRLLREDWKRLHSGPANAGNVAVLWEEMDFMPLSITNSDAQLIEALSHNAVIVGAVLGISPIMLGDMRYSSTRANLEEAQKEYVHRTLARYVNRFVNELESKLIPNRRLNHIIADDSEVLAGDLHTQVEVGARMLESRIATKNEVRNKLGMDPVEGGDIFENPAIDTVQRDEPDDEAEDEPDQEEEESPPPDTLATARRIRQVEGDKLSRQAKQSRNFVEYVDKFYSSGFFGVAETELPNCGEKLTQYAAARRAVVLDLAGRATDVDQLASLISEQNREADSRALAFYLGDNRD